LICCGFAVYTGESDRRFAALFVITSRNAVDGLDVIGLVINTSVNDALVLFTSPTTLYVVPVTCSVIIVRLNYNMADFMDKFADEFEC